MKKLFKNIKSDKITNLAFLFTLVLILINLVFILLSYRNLPPFVPIFNQLPWGEQRLGITITIFIPLLVSLLIFGINLITGEIIYKKIPLVARMLSAICLLISILSFLFIVKTITLIL